MDDLPPENLAPEDLPDSVGEDGAAVADGADGNVVQIAPIIAKKVRARSMYWRGYSLSQIADELAIPYATVASWKTRQIFI